MATITERYLIPAAMHQVKEEIKRSRFITTLGHTPTAEAARAFIAQVTAMHPAANHNCWAYVAGPPGNTAQIGMSDDGEPHGSAGRPMLTVLLHSGIGEVGAVVTRYFGGTLLGKGGLVKAYSGGVQLALATLPVMELIPKVTLDILLDYAAITLFKRLLPDHEAEILREEYAIDAAYRIRLPQANAQTFAAAVTTLTNGQALIEPVTG